MKMTGELEKMFSWGEELLSLCLTKSKKGVDYMYLIPNLKRLLRLSEKVPKHQGRKMQARQVNDLETKACIFISNEMITHESKWIVQTFKSRLAQSLSGGSLLPRTSHSAQYYAPYSLEGQLRWCNGHIWW